MTSRRERLDLDKKMDWSFGEDLNLNLEFGDGMTNRPFHNSVPPQNTDEFHDLVDGLCKNVRNVLECEISFLQGSAPNQFFIGTARYYGSSQGDMYRQEAEQRRQHQQVNVADSVNFYMELQVFNRCTPSPFSEDLHSTLLEILRSNSSRLEIIPESVEILEQLGVILFKFRNGVVVSLRSVPGTYAGSFEDFKSSSPRPAENPVNQDA